MNAAVVRRTQEALGRVIRRPPLTEKLLNKPPFRYLHDIVMEVIRVTGFMKGLYTDAEMKSENVKEKDAKISFLQKAIDVVALVSGEPPSAKPARIVAGHEPERTNELLQLIGKCCLSKLSSDDAVRRVLAGEKGDLKGRSSLAPKSKEADNKHAREEELRARKDKEDRRRAGPHERSASRDPEQKEEPTEDGRATGEQAREDGRGRHGAADREKPPEGDRDKSRSRARAERERGARDRDKDAERERRGEGGKEKGRWRDRDRDRRRARNGEQPRDPDREKSREHEKAEKKSASSGEMPKKPSEGAVKDSKAEAEMEISARTSRSVATKLSKRRSKHSVEGAQAAAASSASVPEESASSVWRERLKPEATVTQKGDSPSDAEGEAGPPAQEKSEASERSEPPNELSPSIRRLPRPGSARPAPPRVKRQESVEALAVDRAGSSKTVSNVIVDSRASDDEDDGQFVVEAAPPLAEAPELEVPAVELEEDEKHGGLVQKILETKKDYEKSQQPPTPGGKEKLPVFESAWKKEKDIVAKEIEKLRTSIQTLCKSALPLGKIMDYIQEDVDAMQNELQLWHGENRQHAEALRQEQSITDGAVEPLRAELAELEQLIREQQDKICAVKASVLRNEDKIRRMVCGVGLSARR
ncbi:TRAF3-interacting protein 1 isoform X3 [Talpa occidentalis]|uniref:TRAF3-interacting protein 1 isoform X3 n=1 Tax=Talpa occidentalis TaxID=50954 RepID=UPI00189058CC|nr:TRAF3-interacting protein 1 isoform X3 [Talpa occidentalis]